jgi:hypothetical protein
MKRTTIGIVWLVALMSASPAQAATPSLATVLSHTHAADVALVRAVSEFNAHALGAGRVDLTVNRNQMGIAVSQTATLIKNAQTPAQRLAAARAVVAVATQASVDERALARVDRVLPKGRRLQRAVIHAAAVDTARTTVAVNRLNALLPTVPAVARPGLTSALAKLTLTHRAAVAQLGADVTSHNVGAVAKAIAAADIAADVTGQQHAINLIQAISPLLPAAAQDGMASALGAIASSLDAQALALAKVRAHAPLVLRPRITHAIALAHAAAIDARS